MEDNINATAEGASGAKNVTDTSNQQGQENIDVKTYTQEDFDKALQSETDKRVRQALKTAQEKWRAEYDEKLKAEKDEAAKLAKMSAEERAEAERQKERERFEQERAQYQREKLEFETSRQLIDKKLSPKFASFLAQGDAETTKSNIEAFEKEFNAAVQKGIEEQLKGKTPKTGAAVSAGITKEQFDKMSYSERVKLYNENKSEYEKLIGGN